MTGVSSYLLRLIVGVGFHLVSVVMLMYEARWNKASP